MKAKLNKKIFFSAFAGVLAGTAIVVPNINLNNTQQSGYVSNAVKNAATSTDTSLAPNANDLYNDYSYDQGFVVANGTVINFYDWLGLKVWSFDVNANSSYLFGFNATVQTLKIKSSSDGSQMYVYGTLTGNKSYIFKLDVAKGSIVPFSNNKVAFLSDGTSTGLISGLNLLTFTNGYMILTPKAPSLYNTNVYVSFSEIDLSTNTIANRTFDISSAVSGQNVYSWGDIVSVQKIDSYYSFAVKYEVSKNGTYRPALVATCLDAQLNTDYAGKFITSKSFMLLDWQNNPISLDNISINVEKLTDTKSTQKILFYMKYSTMNIPWWPAVGCTNFCICEIDSTGSASINVYDAAQPSIGDTAISSGAAQMKSSSDLSTGISGIVGYFNDQASGIVYLVVANSDLSKIGFLPIEDTIIYGDPMGGNIPAWTSISSFASARYQTVSFDFIPGNSGANNIYYGYIQADQQNVDGSVTTKKSFFTLNSATQAFTIASDINYQLGYTDDQIKAKYNNANYPATKDTEKAIVSDLSKIMKNGSQYFAVNLVSDYLLVDTTKNTVKGSITFALDNYWNSGQSQITRSVNLQLNPIKDINSLSKGVSNNDSSNNNVTNSAVSSSTTSSSNVIIYSAIIVAALIGIAVGLVVTKILKNKKRN